MNNYYTLIYITEHLKNKLSGSRFTYSYSPHRNVWEGYFENRQDTIRLIFSAHSEETALFTNKYKSPKKSNVVTFFDSLYDFNVTKIQMPESDRYIEISFDCGKQLLFQLFGNHPNIFLIENQIIKSAFKNPEKVSGNKAPGPRPPKKPKALQNYRSVKQAVIETDPAFPRHLIIPVERHYELNPDDAGLIKSVVARLTDAMRHSAEFRVLEDGNLCLIPEKYLPLPNKKVFKHVNEAVQFVYYKTSHERRLSAKLQTIEPLIDKKINQHQRTLRKLENSEKALERAKEYENTGHILMANAHLEKDKYKESITLTDFYSNNQKKDISLDPDLSIAENAQRYYSKAVKAKKSVEESKKREQQIKHELSQLNKLKKSITSLDTLYDVEDWEKKYEDQLSGLGLRSQKQNKEHLPFRKVMIDNYEVWIGKNSRSNDKLTSMAHKEDIWLHARGTSGSHLVIRMENNKKMPQKSTILKAASLAAWHSKARGAGLVPVIYTKKKYVTKPKGAPAGTVTVQKESVEMVQPQKIL